MWHVKHVLTSRYLEKNTIFLFRNKNSQQKSFLARLYISISRTIFLLFGSRTGVPKICQRARPLIQEQTVRFYLPPLAYASRHMFQPTFFPQHSSTERLIHLPPPPSISPLHANRLSNELFKRTCPSLSHRLLWCTHALRCSSCFSSSNRDVFLERVAILEFTHITRHFLWKFSSSTIFFTATLGFFKENEKTWRQFVFVDFSLWLALTKIF